MPPRAPPSQSGMWGWWYPSVWWRHDRYILTQPCWTIKDLTASSQNSLQHRQACFQIALTEFILSFCATSFNTFALTATSHTSLLIPSFNQSIQRNLFYSSHTQLFFSNDKLPCTTQFLPVLLHFPSQACLPITPSPSRWALVILSNIFLHQCTPNRCHIRRHRWWCLRAATVATVATVTTATTATLTLMLFCQLVEVQDITTGTDRDEG